MTELTMAQLPDKFATVVVYAKSRVAFATQHSFRSNARIYQLTFDDMGAALQSIEKVPLREVFESNYLKESGVGILHPDIEKKDLLDLLAEAFVAKPQRWVRVRRLANKVLKIK